MKRALVLLALTGIWAAGVCQAQPGAAGNAPGRPASPPDNTPRTLSPYFTPATPGPKAPDADGFIQRWLLL